MLGLEKVRELVKIITSEPGDKIVGAAQGIMEGGEVVKPVVTDQGRIAAITSATNAAWSHPLGSGSSPVRTTTSWREGTTLAY